MMNRIVLMGRLTVAPELKKTQSGISVCTVGIACDRPRKQGESNAQTDFFDLVAWRTTAEFLAKYFTKGQLLAVEGRLQSRQWEDNEGHRRKTVEIVADQLHFCGTKPKETASVPEAVRMPPAAPARGYECSPRDQLYELPPSGYGGNEFVAVPGTDDDLPF